MVQQFPAASRPSLSSTNKKTFENKTIVDWFTKETTPQTNTQMLKGFGLKNPQDLMTFLQSSEGKTVQALINKKIVAIKERENNSQSNQDDKQKLVSLILGLAYVQEAAADAAETRNFHMNDMLVQKQLADGQQRIESQQEQQNEASREALNTVDLELLEEPVEEPEPSYNEASEALDEQLDEQAEALDPLEKEIEDIEQAEANLGERTSYLKKIVNNIESFFDLGSEEQEQLTQSAPELKMHFDQKTIVNDEGRAYLVNLDQKLDTLSSEEKDHAHDAYKQLEPNLFNEIKKTIKTSYQEEQEQLAERKSLCLTQCLQRHEEITFVTQQRAALQAAQQQKLQTSLTAEPEFNTAVFKRSFAQMLRLDPVGTIAAQDRLGGPQFLQPTEFGMPIEDQTMRSLQENRAGKGANQSANAVSATAEVSGRSHERLHPDAEPPPKNQAQSALKAALQDKVQPEVKPPEPKQEREAEPDTPSPLSTRPKPQQ